MEIIIKRLVNKNNISNKTAQRWAYFKLQKNLF